MSYRFSYDRYKEEDTSAHVLLNFLKQVYEMR